MAVRNFLGIQKFWWLPIRHEIRYSGGFLLPNLKRWFLACFNLSLSFSVSRNCVFFGNDLSKTVRSRHEFIKIDTLCRSLVPYRLKNGLLLAKNRSLFHRQLCAVRLTAISDDVSLVYLKLYFSKWLLKDHADLFIRVKITIYKCNVCSCKCGLHVRNTHNEIACIKKNTQHKTKQNQNKKIWRNLMKNRPISPTFWAPIRRFFVLPLFCTSRKPTIFGSDRLMCAVKRLTGKIEKRWKQANNRWILFLSSHKHRWCVTQWETIVRICAWTCFYWSIHSIQSVSRGANNNMCNVRVESAGAELSKPNDSI